MSDPFEAMTAEDWRLYQKSYRGLQRMEARAQLREFFRMHLRCAFDIRGRSMAGRQIVVSISAASDATLRTFDEAAKKHRKNR